jgi:hypothetical protein
MTERDFRLIGLGMRAGSVVLSLLDPNLAREIGSADGMKSR